jgi:hypothetical protein
MATDMYLVHASENSSGVQALAEALRSRGLLVWFNSFIVGPSVRDQMEHGLRGCDFGVVVLPPEFFSKRWTRAELDALFGLEQPGEVRILPVWWGTTEAEVREHSPMLAMRAAAVLRDGDIDAVANALFTSITALSSQRSRAKRLRLQIVSGFDWVRPPVILPKSLAVYERDCAEDYYATELVYFPANFTRPPGQPVPLSEIVRSHPLWDGKRVTLIARQVEGTVQVLEELVTDEELPPDPTRPSGAGIAAYVFQLDSVGFSQGELCYVHCIGPYARTNAGMGPNSHDQESLCWVTGLVMAFGFMKNSRGHAVNSIYVAASVVFFTPKMESTDSTC